jgi:superfamily II DNA or RNA helicase
MIFWVKRANRNVKILGVTATAIREDGQSLGQVFESQAFHFPIPWLIRHGYLVRPEAEGHYIENAYGEPDTVLGSNQAPAFVYARWRRTCWDRQTIGYTTTVKEAEEYAEYFNEMGVPANFVHGRMGRQQQREAEADLRSGRVQVNFNAGIWTQGMDFPKVSAILLLRRFGSQLLFIQSVGRGLRLCPKINKVDCRVLGFHPNGMHQLEQKGRIFHNERPVLPTRVPPDAPDAPKRTRKQVSPQLAHPLLPDISWDNVVTTVYDLLTGRSVDNKPFGLRDAIRRILGRNNES